MARAEHIVTRRCEGRSSFRLAHGHCAVSPVALGPNYCENKPTSLVVAPTRFQKSSGNIVRPDILDGLSDAREDKALGTSLPSVHRRQRSGCVVVVE